MAGNIAVLGARMYVARNPRWTKYGKASKPLLGLRANGQIKGPLGIGGQAVIRRAMYETAQRVAGTKGFSPGGLPAISAKFRESFPIRVNKQQKYEERLAASRAETAARWRGVTPSAPPMTPAQPVGFYGGSYPGYI